MLLGNQISRVIRSGRIALVLLIAVVAVGGAASASAETPPIVLCQSYYTGHVRVIQPWQECVAGEARLELQSYAGAQETETELQQQIDDLADRVTALEGRMGTAETDIDNLEGRMDTAETDIDNLEGRMSTAETDIDNLESRVTTAETNITDLDTRVTNIRDFFTGVANGIIGCFDPAVNAGATFSITIPAIVFPEIVTDLFGLLPDPVTLIPETVLFPETTIGFPVFNADDVVPCLNGVVTSTGL